MMIAPATAGVGENQITKREETTVNSPFRSLSVEDFFSFSSVVH